MNDDFKGTLFFSYVTKTSCGVAIGYSGAKSFILEERKTGKNGRLLLLTIDEQNFVLVSLYNANTEKDQLNTINELREMLKSVNNTNAKQTILAKMIELKNTFELCDIWRLRNPKIKRFTFRQNHRTGFIQRRLDFFCFKCFARDYSQNICLRFVLQ